MNQDSPLVSYEAAVQWMREQPELQELVGLSYLDEDNEAAAQRFALSEEFEQVAKWAQLNHGLAQSVLDVGCGNGIASYAMGRLGHHVTALDPDNSTDVGLEATRRLIPSIEQKKGGLVCVLGFVEDLKFPSESFDVVYTRQALHHFTDLERGLKECVRVLKKGGIFIATREHVVDNQEQLEQFLAEHTLHHMHGGENAYPLSRYTDALHNAGFQRVQVFGPWDTVVNHFPASNNEVKRVIAHGIRRRIKLPLDVVVCRIPWFEHRMRKHLTSLSSHPGRLYSFVASK